MCLKPQLGSTHRVLAAVNSPRWDLSPRASAHSEGQLNFLCWRKGRSKFAALQIRHVEFALHGV